MTGHVNFHRPRKDRKIDLWKGKIGYLLNVAKEFYRLKITSKRKGEIVLYHETEFYF